MDSSTSADDSLQELEAPVGGSAASFILFGIACLFIPWFLLTCFACYRRRLRGEEQQDRSEGDGDSTSTPELKTAITEVERRKTLIRSFQRNQVTMVRICAWHFCMKCRQVY
jgi:hypothetical protein